MNKKTMKNYTFDFQIETRSAKEGDRPRYIVKGYATVPDHPYAYRYFKNGNSFKEMFTQKGVENFVKKLKSKNVFVDALHEYGTLYNTSELLKQIQNKTGVNISNEANEIITQIKHSDIPLAKFNSVNLDGTKPFIETELNPLYREVDEKHQKYFDAVWYSLQNGFLNKFSINFKPTETESDVSNGEIIPKINDMDIFGISYTQGAANELADITEVAMRSAMEMDEVKRMEEDKLKKENEELNKKVSELEKKEKERIESEKRQKEEYSRNQLENAKSEIEKQREDLKKQKEEMNKQMEELSKKSSKSFVAPEENFRGQHPSKADEVIKKVLELVPEIKTPKSGAKIQQWGFYHSDQTRPNLNGRVGIGDLIAAQAHGNATSLYAEDTKHFSGKSPDDLIAPRIKE